MFKWLIMLCLFVSTIFGETNTNLIENISKIEKKTKLSFVDTFAEFNRMGGIFIYPLYLLSIIALAYILERFFYYNMKRKLCDEKLLLAIKDEKLSIDDVKNNIENSKTRMGDVLKELMRLSKKRKTVEELDKVLEMEVNSEINELQRGFTIISAIINLAPLIGFLGTVSGMISAFKSIYLADQVSITLVAKGIYEALITTEVGLIIAIVVNFFYSLFVQKLERFTQITVEAGENLIERIVENEN